MEILSSEEAFKQHYVDLTSARIAVKTISSSLGSGSFVVGSSAVAVGHSVFLAGPAAVGGLPLILSHLTWLPLIGEGIGTYVSSAVTTAAIGAASTAAIAAIPAAVGVGLVVGAGVCIGSIRNGAKIHGASHIGGIAEVVGNIVFLPLLGKYNKLLESYPNEIYHAKQDAVRRITEWGYSKEFADELVGKYLGKISQEGISEIFNARIGGLEKMRRNDFTKNGVTKMELKPGVIRKLASIEENRLRFKYSDRK